jgi:hypothetical protein
MSSPFLLRVVPEADGRSWVVREPGTGRVALGGQVPLIWRAAAARRRRDAELDDDQTPV